MSSTVSTILLIHAAVQGIFIAAILLLINKGNGKAKLFLACLSLLISGFLLYYLYEKYEYFTAYPNLIWVSAPAWFLLGPFVFFFTLYLIKPERKPKYIDLVHLFPFMLGVWHIFPFYALPAHEKLEYFRSFYSPEVYTLDLYSLSNLALSLLYILASLIIFQGFYRSVKEKMRSKSKKLLLHTRAFLASLAFFFGIALSITFFLPDFFGHIARHADLLFIILALSTHILGLTFLKANEYPISYRWDIRGEGAGRNKNELRRLAERIENTLTGAKGYLQPGYRISNLETDTGIPSYQLSRVINDYHHTNFNDLINGYRIKEACERLSNPVEMQFTFEAIARSSGFNSTASFYRAFKKQVGKTPRQFQQENEFVSKS